MISTKLLPLFPVSFAPSQNLWRLTLTGYCLFGLSLGAALWPFLGEYPALGLLLLLMLAFVFYSLSCKYRDRFGGILTYSEQGWILQISGDQQRRRLQLNGDVLIWPGLVILPFVDVRTQRVLRLVLAVDSVNAKDFARLRSWLRRHLVPKA